MTQQGKLPDNTRSEMSTDNQDRRRKVPIRRRRIVQIVAIALAIVLVAVANVSTMEQTTRIMRERETEQENSEAFGAAYDEHLRRARLSDDETDEEQDKKSDTTKDEGKDNEDGIWVMTSVTSKTPLSESTYRRERYIDASGNVTSELSWYAFGFQPEAESVEYTYDENGYEETSLTAWLGTDTIVCTTRDNNVDEDGKLVSSLRKQIRQMRQMFQMKKTDADWNSIKHSMDSITEEKYEYGENGRSVKRSSHQPYTTDSGGYWLFEDGVLKQRGDAFGEHLEDCYRYDENRHLVSWGWKHGPQVTYETDENGNVTSMTETNEDGSERQWFFEYKYVPHPSKGARLYSQIDNALAYAREGMAKTEIGYGYI